MAKVELVEDEAYTTAYKALPQKHCSKVSVYDPAGQCIEAEAGGGEDDLASQKSDAWIERKFRAMAGNALGEKRSDDILSSLWALEKCRDVTGIVEALVLE